MLRLVKANPNEITIVALGPLTNIALAIQQDPQTMNLVKKIVAMGGAIDVPGNTNRVAEFNIFVDPEAADIVMRTEIEKFLVPLDPCDRVPMQLEDFSQINNKRLRDLLTRMLIPYIKKSEKDTGVKAAMMYDPLTIFYLLQPDACETIEGSILVETKGELTKGMTVIERRKVGDDQPINVSIVMYIEPQRFIDTFIQKLNRFI